MFPLLPTAQRFQTLLILAPQTSLRSSLVPLGVGDHLVPFQWRIVPPSPTAQTSFEAEPQTDFRNCVVLLVSFVKEPPAVET